MDYNAFVDASTKILVSTLGPIVDYLESLSYLGVNSHFVKIEVLDNAIQPVATSLGMDLTLIKYTLSLFMVYPLASILYAIPDKNVKHLYSFIVGFCLVQWIFGPDWIHTFITSLGTYIICALVPSKHQPQLGFVFVMGYMVACHVYRMYVSYMSGIFDFTGTQMVLTMKLTSFAYNMFDGHYDAKKVFPSKPYDDKKDAKVYGDRAKYAITKLPNPLEFFGYIYCFTCILAGPAFEYKDYENAIDGTVYLQDGKTIKKPSTVLAGLQRLAVGVISLVLHLQIAGRFPVSLLYSSDFINTVPYVQRWGVLILAMIGQRLKFYFAWKLAEGASILGGFGFQGYDSSGKEIGWKGVENIDIFGFETATNVQTSSRHWNKRTQGWLERYTYNRTGLTEEEEVESVDGYQHHRYDYHHNHHPHFDITAYIIIIIGRSLFWTYFTSSIWHGLYPGFFVMFLTLPLLTNVERLLKAKINPLLVPGYDGFNNKTYPKGVVGVVYWGLCWLMVMVFMNYTVQVFSMGSLENSLKALSGHYYVPHLLLPVLVLLLEMVPSEKRSKKA